MSEILGLDLGTNSIGISKRNTDLGGNLFNQLEYYGVTTFNKGVGNSKSGEYSYAAERTKYRSSRRLYQARKYRIWETLKVLIENDYCPLSMEDLDKWRIYDKEKGLKREYPIDAIQFEQWVRLDFDNDGKPEYTSPYQLRDEIVKEQLNTDSELDRYKIGRALYHISQRRGFKSSKGETLKDTPENEELDEKSLQKSEEKKSKELNDFINELKESGISVPTIGSAFYEIEKQGDRIRKEYQAVRSQFLEEIDYIFSFQDSLSIDSDFYRDITKAIFYKRPLRSQKGLIGKCTLETNKHRCPISHPDFEYFRAWSFINNIKFKKEEKDSWEDLSIDDKDELYKNKFLRVNKNFKFEEIRDWIENKHKISLSVKNKTINYKDKVNVSACPISGRLKNLLGNDWREFIIETNKTRISKKTGEEKKVSYNWEDLWHICFTFDDEENIVEFAKSSLGLTQKEIKSFINLWVATPQGYSMLSLKAIRNINMFLSKGLIYSEAALLAKIPEIIDKEQWLDNKDIVLSQIGKVTEFNKEEKRKLNIANALIANYKSLEFDEQFASHNTSYILGKEDKESIEDFCKESYGEKTWEKKDDNERQSIIESISEKYQAFFSNSKREFYKLPKIGDDLKLFLSNKFETLHCHNNFIDKTTKLPCNCEACKKLNKLYHPSMVEFYKPSKAENIEYDGRVLSKKLLQSPKIGAFKNPMAMRMLHMLRSNINHLLLEGIISEDTRIVVETARDLNDSNMRWAIDKYQRLKEEENKAIKKAICELRGVDDVIDSEIDKAKILIDQWNIPEIGIVSLEVDSNDKKDKKKRNIEKVDKFSIDVTKYKLWLEQGCRCIYTGKIINVVDLLGENSKYDIEHTIPRSKSMDNSLANKTICESHYNRFIKKNMLPTSLINYEKDAGGYTAILPRIQVWKDKVEKLKDNVEFWRNKSKFAQVKESKDYAIRQRHLWQMELDYWYNKLNRFTQTEITSGFKNSQLVDTRLISKYATLYLKSVFNNVDVQKGSVTSEFRKIIEVQSLDKKKNRDKHSHHAIDATILTLIPTSAKRDRMLSLFYEIKERKKIGQDISDLEKKLEKDRLSLNIGSIDNFISQIDENILINQVSKDKSLLPTKKRARIRGKIDYLPNGKPKIITGDSIRGQLHQEQFYGAIKLADKDENGNIIRDDEGKMIIGDTIHYVIRRELTYKANSTDSGFKTWEEIENAIVDKVLIKRLQEQYQGKTFKEACEEGLYIEDKKGVKKKIRHIRCSTSVKNPLVIKKQKYLSDKDYKQNYYSSVGDLYALCKYSNKQEYEYVLFNLFDIGQNRLNDLEDIPKTYLNKKETILNLEYILKSGLRVILVNKKESVRELDMIDLLKRLYTILGFETSGLLIKLKYHLCAKEDKELGKGESIKNFEELPEKIRCSINTLNLLIEGIDFEVSPSGVIIFNK